MNKQLGRQRHHYQRSQRLQQHLAKGRDHRIWGQLEGLRQFDLVTVTLFQLAPYIDEVDQQEERGQPALAGEGDQPQRGRHQKDPDKPALIPANLALHLAIDGPFGTPHAKQQGEADCRIADGRQHQRPAKGGANADLLLGGCVAHQQSGQGHDTLG